MTDIPNFTDVTDVESVGQTIEIWVGRSRHTINTGDYLTFVGDSQPNLFTKGHKYRYLGPRMSDEPHDAVYFMDLETGDEVKAYREEMHYYLPNGGFHIHGV